jgi:hypothetical protein
MQKPSEVPEEITMGKWYQLTFQQLQPLHIGAGKWGIVNETAIFIPGQTIWGALVNKYLIEKGVGGEEFQKIKEKFEKISNFFPAFSEDGEFFTPTYQEGEFGYLLPPQSGNSSEERRFISESEFRYSFVDTLLQTAIEPGSRRAKDESLHEMDYILPTPKNGLPSLSENNPTPSLYWKGIIFLEEEGGFLEEGLELYLGGDTRYGVGLVRLVKKEALEEPRLFKKWQLSTPTPGTEIENPKVEIPEEVPFLHFVKIIPEILKESRKSGEQSGEQSGKEAGDKLGWEGEVEVGVEATFSENLPKIGKASYYFSVGTKIFKIPDSSSTSSNSTPPSPILLAGPLKKGRVEEVEIVRSQGN